MAKTIRLKDTYRGKKTNERAIAPGDYAEDDPRLEGLAEYLVTNGHAKIAEGVTAPAAALDWHDNPAFKVTVPVDASGRRVNESQFLPSPDDARNFPDLTVAEVAEIRARYALALRLNAQWNAAKFAHDNAAAPLQGEDIYHSDSSVLTAADDLLTIPGKGVVPDIKVSKAAWAAGEGIVFPEVATGGEVLLINEEDAVPWDEETRLSWQDSDEYRTIYQEREAALRDARDDDQRATINREHVTRLTNAETKWNEVNVRPTSKPKTNIVKGKQK